MDAIGQLVLRGTAQKGGAGDHAQLRLAVVAGEEQRGGAAGGSGARLLVKIQYLKPAQFAHETGH
ncbi:hypothetical protein [Streptomyces sp. NPDC001494]